MIKVKSNVYFGFRRLFNLLFVSSCLLSISACAENNSLNVEDVRNSSEQLMKNNDFNNDEIDDGLSVAVYRQNKTITISGDGLSITVKGEIQFSADDKAIIAMSDDAMFDFEFIDGQGVKHRVMIDSNKQIKSYFRDGEAAEVSNQPQLLAELLPNVLKESAFMANTRVSARFNQFGYEKLKAYVLSVNNESAKGIYTQLMLGLMTPNAKQWHFWLNVAKQFGQQHNQAIVLQALALQMHELDFGFDSPEFVLLSAQVKSLNDHYGFEVYSSYLVKMEYHYRTFAQLLKLVGSDHYQFELLMILLNTEKSLLEQDIHDLVRLFDSEHYKAEVYLNAMNSTWFNSDTVIEAMLALSSDHYRVELLKHFVRHRFDNVDFDKLGNAISYVQSDHYKFEILSYLLNSDEYESQAKGLILEQLPIMGSEHYQAQLIANILEAEFLTKSHISALKESIFRLNNNQLKQMLNTRMTKLEKS